jgi:predicted RNA-binding protein associated with RNAse of E/G family
MRPEVRVIYRKWEDRPHWTFSARLLGEDHHGVWCGLPRGTHMSRPGVALELTHDAVLLVPRDRAFTATFNSYPATAVHENQPELYVDITTVPEFNDGTIVTVDLDLDVLRLQDGSVIVDDEDEFRDHLDRYAYPDAIVRLAEQSCHAVLADVSSGAEPFHLASEVWMTSLHADL